MDLEKPSINDKTEMPDEIWVHQYAREHRDELRFDATDHVFNGGVKYTRADLAEREAVDLDINVCPLCGALPCDQVSDYQKTIDLDKLITEYSKHRSKEYGLAAVCESHAKLLRDFSEHLAASGHLRTKADTQASSAANGVVNAPPRRDVPTGNEGTPGQRAETSSQKPDNSLDKDRQVTGLRDETPTIYHLDDGEKAVMQRVHRNSVKFVEDPERDKMAAAVLDLAKESWEHLEMYYRFNDKRLSKPTPMQNKHAALIDKLRKERK